MSFVLAALAAGVSAGATAGATEAVKSAVVDAYKGLKSVLKRVFAGNEQAGAALTLYESKPTEPAFVAALTDHLSTVATDPDVKAAAKRVLDAAGPAALGPGSVAATVLQIHAESGGVAAAVIHGPVTAGYTPPPGPAGPGSTGPGGPGAADPAADTRSGPGPR
ncbi:hypothetical protein [Cellulomonas sp. URHB0016]